MQAPLRKTALSVALLSMGLAMSAMAQNPGSQGMTGGTSGSSPAATSGSTSGASTSGATSRGATSGGSASSASSSKASSDLARGDRKFIEEAARHGMAEVQLGQLAAQKAQSSEVKQFGQKMVDDHGKANDQLKSLASSKNVQLPTDLDRAHKREYDRLSKLSGAEFDREYMKNMVSDHKKDVSDFRKEAKSAKDSDVKSFAGTTTPTLEQHLQMAQQVDATVRTANRGGNTARTSGSSSGAMSGGTPAGTSGATSGSTSGTTSGSTSGATSGTSSGGMSSGSSTGAGTSGSKGSSGK